MLLEDIQGEYQKAYKAAQKAYKEQTAKGLSPYPAVLDDIIGEDSILSVVDVGLVEIPTSKIVGTKSAGRIHAFTPDFLPLLADDTEFAAKWMDLCNAHFSDSGIRDPILCYEYLGNFYVQEGNKRLSVLRWFGAPRIPGMVKRVMPAPSDRPEVQAYLEFLEFYKVSRMYEVQFKTPGSYAKLLAKLGKSLKEPWSDRERKVFNSNFQYFKEAFLACKTQDVDMLPEDALLQWLQVYSFRELSEMDGDTLKKSLQNLWGNLLSTEQPAQVETQPAEEKTGLLSRFLPTGRDHLNVAFVYQRTVEAGTWNAGHAMGAQHLQEAMGDQVTVQSYFHADSPEQTEAILHKAVADGADIVFTTTPQMCRTTLKVALAYPKVRFLNCSVDAPYSSVRTYYSRVYEGKFITGAIAGAMSDNNEIGYVGSYPIFGVPASINAFALGAQLTNPRAKVVLRWSCQETDPVKSLRDMGITVISNRDIPTAGYLEHSNYGTYTIQEDGTLRHLGSPCWMWGKLYEHVVRSVLKGTWNSGKNVTRAVNYWWGMDSGVIDVELSDSLPEGLLALASHLRQGLQNGTIDPFFRKIVAQDGTVKNDGTRHFYPRDLLHMDWFCDNVVGEIPTFEQILPYSQSMVRELGIYRDTIPPIKEGNL